MSTSTVFSGERMYGHMIVWLVLSHLIVLLLKVVYALVYNIAFKCHYYSVYHHAQTIVEIDASRVSYRQRSAQTDQS